MKNRKRVVWLAVMMLMLAACAGCSGGEKNAAKTEKNQNAKAAQKDKQDTAKEQKSVADMITELTPMLNLESVTTLDAEKIAYYYNVKADQMAESAGVIGDVALADELVIMKAKEGDTAALEKGAKARLQSQKESFQDYIPEQCKRLDDAQIIVKGDYVMYVCCDDVQKVVDKFTSMIQK